jgi:hypothetical protein
MATNYRVSYDVRDAAGRVESNGFTVDYGTTPWFVAMQRAVRAVHDAAGSGVLLTRLDVVALP